MNVVDCPEQPMEAVIRRKGFCRKYKCECWNKICKYWNDNTKLVYLAVPIDNVTLGSVPVADVVSYFGSHFTVYNPKLAFSNTLNTEAFISSKLREINDLVISRSDLFVAVWSPNIPSVGVPLEIDYALRLGIPTIIICHDPESAHKSVYFNSFIERGAKIILSDNWEGQLEAVLKELRLR